MADDVAAGVVSKIVEHIRKELAHSLGQTPQSIEPERLFVDMGADSMILAETLQDVNRRYKVSLAIGEIYETVNTVAKVARHLHDHGQWEPVLRTQAAPAAQAPQPPPAAQTIPAAEPLPPVHAAYVGVLASQPASADTGAIEDIFRRQLELMGRQLSLLGQSPGQPAAPAAVVQPAAPAKP
ncbi:acyl carrier protein, partial [Ramlibacter sp.]|uniref:acyl carrier protein n=1 Tax=Ramlibacter sp. TaxID=1917967 RepID=UPI0017CE3D0F